MGKIWPSKELALLREHYPKGGVKAVAPYLPRHSKKAIQEAAYRHGVSVGRGMGGGPRTSWTSEEDAQLHTHFTLGDLIALSVQLARTVEAIRKRAATLGLRRQAALPTRRKVVVAAPKAPVVRPAPKPKPTVPTMKKTHPKPIPKQLAKPWYHYPKTSPEYQAGEAAYLAGKQQARIIDDYGRPALVWRTTPTT